MVFTWLNEVYYTKRILLENIKNITIRCFQGLLMLHIAACAWVLLKFYRTGDAEFLALLSESLHKSINTDGHMGEILETAEVYYVDAVYFMTTTMTTVGYGDIKGRNPNEQIYLCIVIFVGIAMFTLITQQVLFLRKELTVEDLVKINQEKVNEFILQLDQTRPNKYLDEEIYEDCRTIIEESLRYSTKATFDSTFWYSLTP